MAKGQQTQDTDTLAGSSSGNSAELVEITPLGLSAEQMAKSNPEAVKALQEKAASDAIAAERERRIALDAAFPDDLAYAAECYKAGKSVLEAKAERHDLLAAEVKNLKAKNTELLAKVEAGKPGFTATDGDDAGGNGQSQSDSTAEFKALYAKAGYLHSVMTEKAFLSLAKHEPDRARKAAQSV